MSAIKMSKAEHGKYNREVIKAYSYSNPYANNPEIAAALGMSLTTVARHRSALRKAWLADQGK